jgi:hypothetical protein
MLSHKRYPYVPVDFITLRQNETTCHWRTGTVCTVVTPLPQELNKNLDE